MPSIGRCELLTVLAIAMVTALQGAALAAPPAKIHHETPAPVGPNPPIHHELPEGVGAPAKRAREPVVTSAVLNVVRGRFTSVQVNVDAIGDNIVGDAANEPSIAVDPTNPDRMAIGWREFTTIASAFRQSGYAFTQDGGQSWTFPGVLRENEFASDPVLEADADGNFYYASLQTARGPVSWPVYIYKSSDGGMTWPQDGYAFGGDKQWLAIDRTTGIGRGNVYMFWTPNTNASCCAAGLTFTRSVDGGLTWLSPVTVPGQQFSNTAAVGPDGTLYNFGSDFVSFPPRFELVRSSDAQDAGVTPTFDDPVVVDLDGFRVVFTGPNPGGLLGQGVVAVDHSSSPTRGNLYVLSSVQRISVSDPLDVMFARSEDDGRSFSAPVRVNDDALGNGAFQWFGAMSVAPNGRIDVTWNDTRNDPTGVTSELYYSFSLDGGVTWSINEPVGPSWNSLVGFPGQNKIGDYNDMESDNGGARLAYAATYNGEQDVYYVRLTPDCNGNGIADESDILAGTSDDCNGNLIPDSCESQEDCNINGQQDICDTAGGVDDCNHNFVPDSCEPDEDCNGNGQRDICEVAAGAEDCDGNDIPDECELGTRDCNANGAVDECDVRFLSSPDCNGNGIPDECDIASGFSPDADGNGVPDECVGACCTCATCEVLTEVACAAQAGVHQGLGTTCETSDCSTQPTADPHDDCQLAQALPSDLNVALPFDNLCAGTDGPPNVLCENSVQPVGADMWYEYVAPCCGALTVSLCDATDFDTLLTTYGGDSTCRCPTDDSTLLACGDDTCGTVAGPSVVTMQVARDDCVLIRVAGWSGSTGTGLLDVSLICTSDGITNKAEAVGHRDVDSGSNSTVGNGIADVWAVGDVVFQGQAGAGGPDLDNRVHFFDISDPSNPTRFLEWVVASPNNSAEARDVKVGDGLLFVALFGDGFDGLEIVDVRDPFNPVHLSYVTIPGFEDVRNSFYDSGYLYLANGTTPDIAVVDLTVYDPDAPPALIAQALWTLPAGTSLVEDVTVQNGVLYVAAWNAGLILFDVSNVGVAAPQLLGSSGPSPNTSAVWPTADGRWVLTTEVRNAGVVRLYELIPNLGLFDVVLRDTTGVIVAGPGGLIASPHNVVVDGARAYVTWDEAGLRVFDVNADTSTLVPAVAYSSFTARPVGGFIGAWGVYPFLGTDRIILSDSNTGLHIVRADLSQVSFSYPNGRPKLIDPDIGTPLTVEISPDCVAIDPSTAMLFLENDDGGGGFTPIPLADLGGNLYEVTLPAGECTTSMSYYLSAQTVTGGVFTDPAGAPLDVYRADVGLVLGGLTDDFEADQGWASVVEDCPATQDIGQWERVVPIGTTVAPNEDFTDGDGGSCYVTAQTRNGGTSFSDDTDGGPFVLTSPTVPTGGRDVRIGYARWFYANLFLLGPQNTLAIDISGDGGVTWVPVEFLESQGPHWVKKEFLLSDIMTPGESVTLRFTTSDCPGNSVAEAAIDDVSITFASCVVCPSAAAPLAEPDAVAKNRYVSFVPGNPGRKTAVRVVFRSLPSPHDVANGRSMWLGPPETISELGGVRLSSDAPGAPSFVAASLQCEPFVTDWGAVGTIHVYHDGIMPGGVYEIREIDGACPSDDVASLSAELVLSMSQWGDVVETCLQSPCGPPNGTVDIVFDVVALLDKFKNAPGALTKARADIQPSVPDQLLSITDVTRALDAFAGASYPFSGPGVADPCVP